MTTGARNLQAGKDITYGGLLRQLRESRDRSQASVARSVGISPAQLARLESNQRGLYLDDFVRIAEALGEKPGNLLPNDLGDIGHLKPLIDRLSAIRPEFLGRVTKIIETLGLLIEDAPPQQSVKSRRKLSAVQRKDRP
jgi:transcriptional regulator with XRE-family HTH domain